MFAHEMILTRVSTSLLLPKWRLTATSAGDRSIQPPDYPRRPHVSSNSAGSLRKLTGTCVQRRQVWLNSEAHWNPRLMNPSLRVYHAFKCVQLPGSTGNQLGFKQTSCTPWSSEGAIHRRGISTHSRVCVSMRPKGEVLISVNSSRQYPNSVCSSIVKSRAHGDETTVKGGVRV